MSTISTTEPTSAVLPRREFLDCERPRSFSKRMMQGIVLRHLQDLQGGQIFLSDGCEEVVLGTPSDDNLQVHLKVTDSAFYSRLVAGSGLGLAESYLDGEWTCDDLPTLIRIFCRNLSVAGPRWTDTITRSTAKLGHWLSRNTKANSRKNIHAHYDLGNDFFSLFLDDTMMYSAGMFESSDSTLEDAQKLRMDEVCRSLDLRPEDHVVEIGTGWGGMAIHMAREFGCRVTTTTISQEQFDFATARVREAGLQDRITLLLKDYRDLDGQFDKLVSLEMIEAVGPQFHDTYFSKCGELLKPDGRMLIQAITMPEQRYSRYLQSVDFIQKYIFPGGSLPSVQAMQQSVAKNTTLRMISLTDFADGYARTLREWRRRFFERLDDVREQGFSDRFIRMWDYYLAYCEGAFDERAVGVAHAVWGK